jgi:hypothetical protein
MVFDYRRREGQTNIEVIEAKSIGGPYYETHINGQKKIIAAFHDQDEPCYFPFHTKCLEIAKRVVSHRHPRMLNPGDSGTSIEQLLQIYQDRNDNQAYLPRDTGHFWPTTRPFSWLVSPTDYYGAPSPTLDAWTSWGNTSPFVVREYYSPIGTIEDD